MRWQRKPGVLPNTFQAPQRSRLVGAARYPDSWSEVVGTPISLGHNDTLPDCVAVAAINSAAVADARRGIMTPFADQDSVDLFTKLGGTPTCDGLDPGVLFTFWQANSVGGYRLRDITALGLDDVAGMEQAIIDTGLVYATFALQEAQLSQDDWEVVPGSPDAGGHATILTWWEAEHFYDSTWGEQVRVSPDFIHRRGMNLWRLDLVPAP